MKKIRVYGNPRATVSYYSSETIDASEVTGKKPRGWNMKYSRYKVKVRLYYCVIYYENGRPLREFIARRHEFTVRKAVYSNRNVSREDWLDAQISREYERKVKSWAESDEQEITEYYGDNIKSVFLITERETRSPDKRPLIAIERTG